MKPGAVADADSVRTGESADSRYWAFISYSHADKAWGDWLHRALNTRRTLVDQDKSNTLWQRNLSISYTNLGDLFKLENKLPEALLAFRQAQAVSQQLVDEDGSNATWQDDLSWACNKVGDVLLVQGNFPEAVATYEQALAINRQLVERDPKRTVYQSDLSASYEKLGDVAFKQSQTSEALGSYQLS